MFRALASFSPVLILLIGALPAAGLSWFASEAKHALFDAPAIRLAAEQSAEAKCTLRVTLAADAAEQAERDRQSTVQSDVLAAYRAALSNSERLAAQAAQRLDEEIASYETQLLAQGRLCPVTQPDIDFMYGRHAPGTAIGR